MSEIIALYLVDALWLRKLILGRLEWVEKTQWEEVIQL